MAYVLKTVIQARRDTTENWLLNKDVIPAAGEPCLDLDTGAVKWGDGVTTYEHLPATGPVSGDGKTILISDGIAHLFGSETAVDGQQLRIKDGAIEWFTPDTSTADGLASVVAGHTSAISDLENRALSIEQAHDELVARVTANEEDILENRGLIDILNGTGDGSVVKTVDDKFAAWTQAVSDDGTVNTFKELIDYVNEHGAEAGELAAAISALEASVAEHQALLDTIEEGAQVNKIDEVSDEFEIADKILSIKTIAMDKVSGLPDALASRDNIVEKLTIAGVDAVIQDKTAIIPAADNATYGVVVGAEALNKVFVANDGLMEVHSLSVSKLVQAEDEVLIMDGGKAAS